ncbi:MAG: hypothetical protein HY455_00295 [Parcubacteria group bacterium]|nr:hypothetical protein [Parcubacteria group bacterium]
MALIIGLVGKPKRGKGTCTKIITGILKEYDVGIRARTLTFSADLLAPELVRRALPLSRENMQRLAQEWVTTEGAGALSRRMKILIESESLAGVHVIFVDGVRWFSDRDLIRSFPLNFLLYVYCSPEAAYKRSKEQNDKAGDQTMSFEEFMRLDGALNERSISEIGRGADFVIDNEVGDREGELLRAKIEHNVIPKVLARLGIS